MRSRQPLVPVASLAAVLLAVPVGAADYFVDRTADSATGACTAAPDDCSLRAAILLANAGAGADTVYLESGTFALTLAGAPEDSGVAGDLDVTDSVTLVGRGAERTMLDAGGAGGLGERVLDVHPPAVTVVLRGITVTGGHEATADGGGLRALDGVATLRLESTAVRGNVTVAGTGAAIYAPSASTETAIRDSWITANTGAGSTVATGRLRLDYSTVSGNVSTGTGAGALHLFAGIHRLQASTISGHASPGQGGGVLLTGAALELHSCTLAGNAGDQLRSVTAAPVVMTNTIFVGTCELGCGQVSSDGGNLESPVSGTCCLGPNDFQVADAGIAPLGDRGGPAPVHALLATSPALDTNPPLGACMALDQRRLSRPRDGDGAGGPACDIGAAELSGPGEIFADGFECGFATAWSSAAI